MDLSSDAGGDGLDVVAVLRGFAVAGGSGKYLAWLTLGQGPTVA